MKRFLLVLLVLAMVLPLTACTKKINVGDTVEMEILRVYCADELRGTGHNSYKAASGETLFIIETMATNISQKEDAIDYLLNSYLYISGKTYNVSFTTQKDNGEFKRFLVMRPGDTSHVFCIFEIPDNKAGETADWKIETDNSARIGLTMKLKPSK